MVWYNRQMQIFNVDVAIGTTNEHGLSDRATIHCNQWGHPDYWINSCQVEEKLARMSREYLGCMTIRSAGNHCLPARSYKLTTVN